MSEDVITICNSFKNIIYDNWKKIIYDYFLQKWCKKRMYFDPLEVPVVVTFKLSQSVDGVAF